MDKGAILILITIGLIIGLALVGTEIVNPFSGAAAYERNKVVTERQAQQDQIDLKSYQAIQETMTRAEQERIEAQAAQQAALDQQTSELEMQQKIGQVKIDQERQRQALANDQAQAALERDLLRIGCYVLFGAFAISLACCSVGLCVWMSRRAARPAAGDKPNTAVKNAPATRLAAPARLTPLARPARVVTAGPDHRPAAEDFTSLQARLDAVARLPQAAVSAGVRTGERKNGHTHPTNLPGAPLPSDDDKNSAARSWAV